MKGLILAGGSGSRLRPLTHSGAKQLVPVANTPILFYALAQLSEAGIVDVGVVVGDTGDEIRAAVGDGSRWGVRVTYIDQDRPLGLAHAVAAAGPFLGDDDTVMVLGDNLLEQGIVGLVDAWRRDRSGGEQVAARILLAEVEDPTAYGVAELSADGSKVVRLVEKPTVPPSNLALVGAYAFGPEMQRAVAAIEPSARGELEITDALSWLIDHGFEVRHEVLQGWWIDTGKVTPLLVANELVLDRLVGRVEGEVDAASALHGAVVVEAGAEVRRSRVQGPAIIGAGARLVDSAVGPYVSVGPGCEITGSRVEHSLLLAGARVTGVDCLARSVLGRHASVARAGAGASTSLVLGDHSAAELGR